MTSEEEQEIWHQPDSPPPVPAPPARKQKHQETESTVHLLSLFFQRFQGQQSRRGKEGEENQKPSNRSASWLRVGAELGEPQGCTGVGWAPGETGRRGTGSEDCKAGLAEGRSFRKLPSGCPPSNMCWGAGPALAGAMQGWVSRAQRSSSLFTQPLPCVSLLLAGIGGPCHCLLPPVLLLTLTAPSSPSLPPSLAQLPHQTFER